MISADEIYDSALHTFANEANAVAKLADTVDRESYVCLLYTSDAADE